MSGMGVVEKTCLEKFFDVLDEIQYGSMPDKVREKAIHCVADYASVFQAGQHTDEAARLFDGLCSAEAALDPEDLALYLGSVARLMDMDDGHRFAMGHPGVPVISGALAALTLPGARTDGETFLTAICRGYETYGYLGRSINPSAYLGRGFDATSICGAGAATVAAATVLGVDRATAFHATAMACMLCGGLTHSFEDGSDPKFLCAGWAARLAITMLRLAQAGMVGPREAMEGLHAYASAFSDDVHGAVMNDPKLNWEVLHVYFKRFACVRRIHASLDCLETILQENKIELEDIERIDVYAGQFLNGVRKYDPDQLVIAQSSLPYSVGVYLVFGKVSMELMRGNLQNERVKELMRKTFVIESPEMNELMKNEPSLWGAARVVLTTRSGKTFSHEEQVAMGDAERPFTPEVMHSKFLQLLSDLLPTGQIEDLWERTKGLPQTEDLKTNYLPLLLS